MEEYECPECFGTMVVNNGRHMEECTLCNAGKVDKVVYEMYYGGEEDLI